MRLFFTIILNIFLVKLIIANAAQPGIFSSGGAAFNLLIEKDSFAFQKLQMVDEEVYIQLYKGFAVVKGKYHIQNNSSDSISFKMGYPINSIYDITNNGDAQVIEFDDLYSFKVVINNQLVELDIESIENNKTTSFDENNWKVWTCNYLPNENKTIEVYFIVKTNNAHVRKGYNNEQKNAFIYLFESGATWGNPILKGQLAVQLKDNLTYKDIKGLSNPFQLKYNTDQKILLGNFENLTPTQNDNFIITYGEVYDNINFNNIKNNAESYFTEIKQFEKLAFSKLELKEEKFKNPFETKTTILGYLPMVLMLLVIYSPFIIGFLLILIILVWWYKKRRK